MSSEPMPASELLEILSYDFFATGFGFSFVGVVTRTSNVSVGEALLGSAALLGAIGYFFWRVSQSTKHRP